MNRIIFVFLLAYGSSVAFGTTTYHVDNHHGTSLVPILNSPGQNSDECFHQPAPSYCQSWLVVSPQNAGTVKIEDCRDSVPKCIGKPIDEFEDMKRAANSFVHVRYQYRDKDGKIQQGVGWIDTHVLKEKDINYIYELPFSDEADEKGIVPCPYCSWGKNSELTKLRDEAQDLVVTIPHKKDPDTFSNSLWRCPDLKEPFVMAGAKFSLTLKKGIVRGPLNYTAGFGIWKHPTVKLSSGDSKNLCHIEFPKKCGQTTDSPIEKLDWMAATLKKVNANICMAALKEFYQQCSLWADWTPKKRRTEALKLAQEATDAFHTGSDERLFPKAGKPLSEVPVTRSDYLRPHLVQCLMRRENADFLPNKLNFTECATGLRNKRGHIIKPSSANGLFQLLESTVDDFYNRQQYKNYCTDFGAYWKKEGPCLKAWSGKGLVKRMGQSPQLQMAIAIKTLNNHLLMAERKLRGEGHLFKLSREEIVREALANRWFTTEDPEDDRSVMDCEKCMDQNGGDVKCLQKARCSDDLGACP